MVKWVQYWQWHTNNQQSSRGQFKKERERAHCDVHICSRASTNCVCDNKQVFSVITLRVFFDNYIAFVLIGKALVTLQVSVLWRWVGEIG